MANKTYWKSPIAQSAFVHIAKADTEVPKGASFKPDGKFKLTTVFAPDFDLSDLQDLCMKVLRDEFGGALPAEDELNLPIKVGKPSKNAEKPNPLEGKLLVEAKSQFRPKIYDGTGALAPAGVYPRAGDEVRIGVELVPYKKTEKVREKGKMVDVDLYGVSLRLNSVQIARRGTGGGGAGFEAVEDGYVASAEDARPTGDEASEGEVRRPAANCDF